MKLFSRIAHTLPFYGVAAALLSKWKATLQAGR